MIFEETITTPMVEHVHLEPHVAVAEVDDLGELLVMTSAQRPHNCAATLAEVMQMPMHKIRVRHSSRWRRLWRQERQLPLSPILPCWR